MSIATLGALGDVQILDGLDEEESKRYMHHYNFPAYSVGEARPSRGPGRREIGHGALAEKALVPVIPSKEEFPYAIRVVSEILSSNGSTSQASICGSTLALMDAGVPIKAPVAGISTGLVTATTLNVRSGPSKEYDKLGSISQGVEVRVRGIVEPDWYVIDFDGEEGYISSDYVIFTPEDEIEGGFALVAKKYMVMALVVAILILSGSSLRGMNNFS